MAKALVIGGEGTLGSAIVAKLKEHGIDTYTAGRSAGDYTVDMTDTASISALFDEVGELDHVVIAAGSTHYDAVPELTPENNLISVNNKLLGQVNTVLLGQHQLNDNGSFTLVSGILKEYPIPRGASSSMVNGAIDAFVQINLTEDPGRGGAAPDEIEALAERVLDSRTLRLRGVMAVAPIEEDPARAFARLRGYSDRVRALAPEADAISAGMTHDYAEAIAEGATHLRIGTAITGKRPEHG